MALFIKGWPSKAAKARDWDVDSFRCLLEEEKVILYLFGKVACATQPLCVRSSSSEILNPKAVQIQIHIKFIGL